MSLREERALPPPTTLTADPTMRAVVDAHRPMVASICRRYLRGADVDDAVQETFVRLVVHGAGQPIRSLPAWLSRVARALCLDVLRRRDADRRRVAGARLAVPDARAIADAGAHHRHAAIEARLALAMRQLSDADQTLIAERFVAEAPLRAIAARTGESIATVSRRATRALQTLAAAMRELGIDGIDGGTLDDHLLAEHFADPAYAAAHDARAAESPLRATRARRSLERSLSPTFATSPDGGDVPAIVGPRMPGWTRPIRVGALVSHATILAVGHRGTTVPGETQVRSTGLLVDPRLELVAIVEPRTTRFGPVERTIRDYALLDGLIEATDVGGLASLDVILLGLNMVISMPIVGAIREAVARHGVGLLKEGWLGAAHLPQLPAEAGDLMLAGSPMYAYHMPGDCGREVDAIVCARSPLTGDLGVGSTFRVGGCGPCYLPAPDATVWSRRDHVVAPAEHGFAGVGTLPSPLFLTGPIGRGRAAVFNDWTHAALIAAGTFGPGYLENLLAWLAEPRRLAEPDVP